MRTDQPDTRTLKIATCGPIGDWINAERIGPDHDPVAVITITSDADNATLRRADWHAFRDAVDDMLGEPRDDEDEDDGTCRAPAPKGSPHGHCTRLDGHAGPHESRSSGGNLRERWDPADSGDPLAHVVPGDPDPTIAAFRGTGPVCKQTQDSYPLYGCTREAGHPGHHIAGVGVGVAAVWSDA